MKYHMLFGALDNIYSLIMWMPDKRKQMIILIAPPTIGIENRCVTDWV
jgi:hypothetical protein